MDKKEKAPEDLRGSTRANVSVQYKDSKILLSKLQYNVFSILSNGKKHSSHQLMKLVHTSDPRKEIQYLRRKGVEVLDEWVAASGKYARHKLFFIDPKECGKGVADE